MLPKILQFPEASPELQKNREGWLTELAHFIEPVFAGYSMKPYRLTCGWPCKGGTAKKARRVGECHSLESSKGGLHEIFISPVLDEPLEVAGTVCHEMAHVAATIEAAHGKKFRRVCRHVGLTSGKPSSVMPGDQLNERLQKILRTLGEYPHHGLRPVMKPVKPSLHLTLECPGCGCKVRIALKWLEEAGLPSCGCGTMMEPKEKEDAAMGPH